MIQDKDFQIPSVEFTTSAYRKAKRIYETIPYEFRGYFKQAIANEYGNVYQTADHELFDLFDLKTVCKILKIKYNA